MGYRHFYCSICGVVLAPSDRNEGFPLWCKAIRALFKIGQRTILTEIGIVDNGLYPFSFPTEGMPQHLKFKDGQQDEEGSCFPFHAACWELYSDCSGSASVKGDSNTLFAVLNSMWYDNGVLSWGHDYGGAGPFQCVRWLGTDMNSPLMADPRLSSEDLLNGNEAGKKLAIDFVSKASNLETRTLQAHDPFRILPYELISETLLYLSSTDVLNLRLSSRAIALTKLSVGFWKSRFWPRNELGFARSLRRPENYTWENWYVLIREQCKSGPNHKNFMNRKRIWHLVENLVELASTVKSRMAFGSPTLDLSLERSLKVACVPSRKFLGPGCRELTRRAISFDYSLMSQLRGLKITSVVIGDRTFVSGLRFVFDGGNHTCLGYVDDSKDSWMGYNDKSRTDLSIQMLFGSEGFETITLEAIPPRRRVGLPMTEDRVFAQIPLRYLRDLMIGLDAMRIVSISASFTIEHNLDFTSLCWRKGLPSSIPFINDSDMVALQSYQRNFSPASHVIFGKPESSSALLIITIFTKSPSFGITGMRFDYANGERKIWGVCKGAALNFFLNGIGESVTVVETCQIGSVVTKLKLTTSLQRTCIFPGESSRFMEHNMEVTSRKYIAARHGNIVGFCGCFVGSQGILACLGFFTDTDIICGSSSLDRFPETSFTDSAEDITVSVGVHGEFRSQITLDEYYDSVQASVESVGAEFREQGQITGLLFRSSSSDHPELIGQWIEPGEKYHLAANERILGINITTWRGPSNAPRRAAWMYQVRGIALVTSCRTLLWGQGDGNKKELKPASITWNFNAVYDYITGDGPGSGCSEASRKNL